MRGLPHMAGTAESGVTLLELLIVMALLALIMGALFGSLRFNTRLWVRTETHAQAGQDIGAVQQILRNAFIQAYPLLVGTETPKAHVDFEGSSHSVAFLAPAPAALSTAGRARYGVEAEPSGTSWRLVLTVKHELSDQRSPAREVLIDDLSDVAFSYFGTQAGTDHPQWSDHWHGQTLLPSLIRIRLATPPGDGRRWPDLVVAPRIIADVGCVYDPLTSFCRGR